MATPDTVLSHTSDERHRGVVTVWTSSIGTLAFAAIDCATSLSYSINHLLVDQVNDELLWNCAKP